MRRREAPRDWRALRRGLLTALAVMLAVAAHLRPVYQVTVAGQAMPGRYSPAQIRRCTALAWETAEEILADEVPEPRLERSLRLSLSPADGSEAALTDALLRSTEGIAVSDEVIVNGTRLGTVEDGRRLCQALESSIRIQMPMAAVSGSISGRLELRRVYTRAGQDTPTGDMVLLITGMAPVIYVDSDGKLA